MSARDTGPEQAYADGIVRLVDAVAWCVRFVALVGGLHAFYVWCWP